jgi:hypothetical protein
MEKDIDRIPKNPETDIVIRIDDFGGKSGLTIREFVRSERYTGFTKAGTRISAEQFANFKKAINSINESDFQVSEAVQKEATKEPHHQDKAKPIAKKQSKQSNYEELEM